MYIKVNYCFQSPTRCKLVSALFFLRLPIPATFLPIHPDHHRIAFRTFVFGRPHLTQPLHLFAASVFSSVVTRVATACFFFAPLLTTPSKLLSCCPPVTWGPSLGRYSGAGWIIDYFRRMLSWSWPLFLFVSLASFIYEQCLLRALPPRRSQRA